MTAERDDAADPARAAATGAVARDLVTYDHGPPRILIASLLLLAVVQVLRSSRPALEGEFRLGFLGENAARYAMAGRNYLRHGFCATLFAPDFTPGASANDGERMLYLHHPPLAPWLVGLSFRLFGESERAAVWPFLALAVAATLMLFLVARQCLHGAAPAFAALLFALTPMTGFYGAHVDPQGSACTVAILLMTLAFLRHRLRADTTSTVGLAGAVTLAQFTDWPAALLALCMPFVARRFPGSRPAGFRWPPVIVVVCCGAFLLWIVVLGERPWRALVSSAGARSWSVLGDSPQSLIEMFRAWAGAFVELFTAPLLLLAVAAIVPPLRRAATRGDGAFGATFWLLFAPGGLYVVLFPSGALVHDYWSYLIVPPVALAAAAVIESARVAIARSLGTGFSLLVAVLVCAGVAIVGDRTTTERFRVAEERARALPHPILGRIVRQYTRPGDRVATNLPYNPIRSSLLFYPSFTYYADRRVRGNIQTVEDLRRAEQEEGRFDRFVFIPAGGAVPITDHLFQLDPGHLERDNVLPPGSAMEKVRVFVFDLHP